MIVEEEENDDGDDNDGRMPERNASDNNSVGEWDHINTGNSFNIFKLYDVVMGWFDDKFYIAEITSRCCE
jgi:hypothetical protein